jgi:hypothetical protein
MSDTFFVDSSASLVDRLQTRWDVSEAVILYPNTNLEPPSDPSESWARVHFLPVDTNLVSIGGVTHLEREEFLMVVSIFTPRYEGDTKLRLLAGKIASIFRYAEIRLGTTGVIRCRSPRLAVDGEGDTVYFMGTVTIPCQRDGYIQANNP